jgi:hypothetical protein
MRIACRCQARRLLEIFNTDQGAQFTSDAFTTMPHGHGVAIGMDGRGLLA